MRARNRAWANTKEGELLPNPVVHFEIMGKNEKQTQKWYSDMFGWKIDPMPMGPGDETYGIVGAQDGKGIGGGVGGSREGQQPSARVYIEVDDPRAYMEKIEKAGGKVVLPVSDMPMPGSDTPLVLGMFADPDGNVIGLVKAGSM